LLKDSGFHVVAFHKVLKQNLDPKIQLREIDAHINEPAFAAVCVGRFIDLFNQESQ